jgi:hypothetical protein
MGNDNFFVFVCTQIKQYSLVQVDRGMHYVVLQSMGQWIKQMIAHLQGQNEREKEGRLMTVEIVVDVVVVVVVVVVVAVVAECGSTKVGDGRVEVTRGEKKKRQNSGHCHPNIYRRFFVLKTIHCSQPVSSLMISPPHFLVISLGLTRRKTRLVPVHSLIAPLFFTPGLNISYSTAHLIILLLVTYFIVAHSNPKDHAPVLCFRTSTLKGKHSSRPCLAWLVIRGAGMRFKSTGKLFIFRVRNTHTLHL